MDKKKIVKEFILPSILRLLNDMILDLHDYLVHEDKRAVKDVPPKKG